MGGQEDVAGVLPDAVVEGGVLAAAGAAHPGDPLGDALHLGSPDGAGGVVVFALGGEDLGHVGQGDVVQPVGGGLDLRRAVADGGEGAGVGHGQLVGAADAQHHILQLGHALVQAADEGGELVGEHGTGGVADGDGLRARGDGGPDGVVQEGGVASRCVVGDELGVSTEGGAGGDGFPDGSEHGVGLLVEQVLHLNGTDGGHHLEPGLLCLLQGVPGDLDAPGIQRHGHRHDALPDRGSHGLDPQGIDLCLNDGLELDDIHAQLVEELGYLDLLPEGQGDVRPGLLHGHVADSDLVHNGCSFSRGYVEFIAVGRGHDHALQSGKAFFGK